VYLTVGISNSVRGIVVVNDWVKILIYFSTAFVKTRLNCLMLEVWFVYLLHYSKRQQDIHIHKGNKYSTIGKIYEHRI